MKLTKSQFVQLIKESYQKKLLSEAGNDQDIPEKAPGDVQAIGNLINARLQGKAEWREGAKIMLEFIFEFLEEGATSTDLQAVAKDAVGPAEGGRLYQILKVMADTFRDQSKPSEDPPRQPGNRSDDVQKESMSSAYPQKGSMSSVQKDGEQKSAIAKLEAVVNSDEASDEQKRKAAEMLKQETIRVKSAIKLWNAVPGLAPEDPYE